jgi:hypothetical protein
MGSCPRIVDPVPGAVIMELDLHAHRRVAWRSPSRERWMNIGELPISLTSHRASSGRLTKCAELNR